MTITVRVTDSYGEPVVNASVKIDWRGSVLDHSTGKLYSNYKGEVYFRPPPTWIFAPFGATGQVEAKKGLSVGNGVVRVDNAGNSSGARVVIQKSTTHIVQDITSGAGSAISKIGIVAAALAVAIAVIIVGLRR
jgi:hypothetical protein